MSSLGNEVLVKFKKKKNTKLFKFGVYPLTIFFFFSKQRKLRYNPQETLLILYSGCCSLE